MKNFFSIVLALVMIFMLGACSDNQPEENPQNTAEFYALPPILGVHIRNGDKAGFYALTKNGTYTWSYTDEKGETVSKIADGIFCLDSEELCSFRKEDAGESIELKFTGNVESYKVYCAERSELEKGDKTAILDEKYLVSSDTSKITFPESGEYYYVVNVNYTEGELLYGFLLAE